MLYLSGQYVCFNGAQNPYFNIRSFLYRYKKVIVECKNSVRETYPTLHLNMLMIFIEETFSLKVVFKRDFYAENLNYLFKMIKSKTTNRVIIKNVYIITQNKRK